MSIRHQLREQIDACRPGSNDLALPELAELAKAVERTPALAEELARSQQLDFKVAAALHDLPVPAGLAERLLAVAESKMPAPEVNLPLAISESGATSARSRRRSRRRWLLAGGSLALVALLALSAYPWLRTVHVVAREELGGQAAQWLQQLPTNSWQAANRLPPNVAIDPAVAARPRQWQPLTIQRPSGWSASVTAVDLSPSGPEAPRAVLFVVKSSASFAVPAIPTATSRLSLSGGFAATAWQRPGSAFLYVLVVEERGGQRLDDYLRNRSAA
jgi:hypothetical protein